MLGPISYGGAVSSAAGGSGGVRGRLLRSHLAVASVGFVMLGAALLVLLGLRARVIRVLEAELPLADSALSALGAVHRSVAELQSGLILDDRRQIAARSRIWEAEIAPAMARLRHLVGRVSFLDQDQFHDLQRALDALRDGQRRVEEAALTALGRGASATLDPEVRRRLKEELEPARLRVVAGLSGIASAERASRIEESRQLRLMTDAVVWFSAGLLLALLLSTLVMARQRADWLVAPIARLAEATAELARHRVPASDIPVEGDDELAELTRSFNRMRQELARHGETVRQTVGRLQTAITGLLSATAQHVSGAEEQAADARQVAEAIENVADSARESARRARSLEESAEWADAISKVGHESLGELRRCLAEIEEGLMALGGAAGTGSEEAVRQRLQSAAARAVELLRRTEDTIKTLAEIADEGRELASQTLAAADRQSARLDEIRHAMAHLSAVIEENLTSTGRVERVARDLDRLSAQLQGQIGREPAA